MSAKIPPQRIVSLVPSWTESLFEFGAGDRVVGVTDYCVSPRAGVAGKPKVGGTKNPRLDQILALEPDLIIVNVEENRRADAEALLAAGARLWISNAHNVERAIAELEELGRLIGAENVQEVVEPILAAYRQASSQRPKSQPYAFVAIWRDPWMTANGDTYTGDLIQVCGAINVFRHRKRRFPLAADLGHGPPKGNPALDTRYPRVSLEEVAAARPDIILLPDEPYPFSELDAKVFCNFGQIPAVQNGRIHVIDGRRATWYGVGMGEAIGYLSRLIHG